MNIDTIFVRVSYTPRGKLGAPLAPPLNFIGECLGRAVEDGKYKIKKGTSVYAVQVQDMFEL